jgi:hypothetical protein
MKTLKTQRRFIPRGLKPRLLRHGWLWPLGHSALKESWAKARVGSIIFLLLGTLFFSWAARTGAETPSLSLKDSIKIAEEALSKAGVDISHHYLYSITLSHASQGDYWYYTYRPIAASEYKEIFVRVFMDGTAKVYGGNASASGY